MHNGNAVYGRSHKFFSQIHKSQMSEGGMNDYALHADDTLLNGYLHKKTREGKWQKRWFEINGIYLTYYKSKKMEKLLAALSLAQVG